MPLTYRGEGGVSELGAMPLKSFFFFWKSSLMHNCIYRVMHNVMHHVMHHVLHYAICIMLCIHPMITTPTVGISRFAEFCYVSTSLCQNFWKFKTFSKKQQLVSISVFQQCFNKPTIQGIHITIYLLFPSIKSRKKFLVEPCHEFNSFLFWAYSSPTWCPVYFYNNAMIALVKQGRL